MSRIDEASLECDDDIDQDAEQLGVR
jgi:hypothetical protein